MTVFATAAVILGLTWLLEKWRSRQQWKHGDWITVPLWFIPLTAIVALMVWSSGIWVGGRMTAAGDVLQETAVLQCEAIDGIRNLDSAVLNFFPFLAPRYVGDSTR